MSYPAQPIGSRNMHRSSSAFVDGAARKNSETCSRAEREMSRSPDSRHLKKVGAKIVALLGAYLERFHEVLGQYSEHRKEHRARD